MSSNEISSLDIKVALITGISGQDGAYLARHLITKGYHVYGTTRDVNAENRRFLGQLQIADQIKLVSMDLKSPKSTIECISKVCPHEIYHLAGLTSVGSSFEAPLEAIESITMGTLNVLEALRSLNIPAKFCHASSSECFGDTGDIPADESTPFRPVSPYGIAKSAAHLLTRFYRLAHKIYATNGILFNHESEMRHSRFVTQKIIQAAHRISQGSKEKLRLGDLSIVRDWGWAPEYVDAMWRILQASQADDYIIATGEANSLKDFVGYSFGYFGLHWSDHVLLDKELVRPCEIFNSRGNPQKAFEKLGWRAKKRMKDVIKILIEAQQSN